MSLLSTFSALSSRALSTPTAPIQYKLSQLLQNPEPTIDDEFGLSVDISNDGTYIIVGAPFDDEFGSSSGAAYIFINSDGTWVLQQKLTSVGATSGQTFGYSVAINGAGDYAIIGAPSNGNVPGSVYIFTRSGTVWTQQAQLSTIGFPRNQGWEVAINDAGDRIAYSSISDEQVYSFSRSGTTWTELDTIVNPLGTDNDFGHDISMDSSGDYLLICSVFYDGGIYVYYRTGGAWTLQQQLWDYTGRIISGAINKNATKLIIGNGSEGAPSKRAFIYTRTGSTWTLEQTILPNINDISGYDVAIAGSVNILSIASAILGTTPSDAITYIYGLGSSWMPQQTLNPAPISQEDYTQDAAFTDDGSIFITGSPRYDTPLTNAGGVYIYTQA